MTPTEFKAARLALGYTTTQMADALGLRQNGKRTVERIEAGAQITGPMALAVQHLSERNG